MQVCLLFLDTRGKAVLVIEVIQWQQSLLVLTKIFMSNL